MAAGTGNALAADGVLLAPGQASSGNGRRRRYVAQWRQDKGPFVHSRVGNRQLRQAHDAPAK